MWKAVGVMFVATIIVSMGNGLLSKGMRELSDLQWTGTFWSGLSSVVVAAIHKPTVLVGVACHATFFGLMLLAFSWGDLSLVLPISAFTFVFGVIIARFYLNEDVGALRWIGSLIIMIGVITVLAGEYGQEGLARQSTGTVHIGESLPKPVNPAGNDEIIHG